MPTNLPTVASNARVLDLDALVGVAGRVRLLGREVSVREIDGAGYRAYSELLKEDGTADSLASYYAIAARCLPDLAPGEVEQLTPRQVGVVIEIAAGGIANVQARFPNSDGPVTETTVLPAPPSPPASTPTTLSDSSVLA